MKQFVLAFVAMAVLILGIFGAAKLFYPQQPCSHCKVNKENPSKTNMPEATNTHSKQSEQ